MPKYKIKFWREVISTDELTRVIQAPDLDSAIDRAREMASDYNMSCPDDAEETGEVDCKAWEVDHDDAAETNDPADDVDEVVKEEGGDDAKA